MILSTLYRVYKLYRSSLRYVFYTRLFRESNNLNDKRLAVLDAAKLDVISSVYGNQYITVVSAVYNVSDYLPSFFSSIVNQDISFVENIKIVIVDDGSTDNSADICKTWAEKFPDNILYIKKDNGGQASARNLGIEYVDTKWVTFIDPDDFVNDKYFSEISRVIQESRRNLSLIASNMIFFYEAVGKFKNLHPLKYRFKGRRRFSQFSLSSCKDIHLSASAAAFRIDIIRQKNMNFNIKTKPSFEDAEFCIKYLLETNTNVAFLRDSKYYYRKRDGGGSTLDGVMFHKGTYFDVLKYALLPILERDISPPVWVQRTMLYHLIWHFRYFVDNTKKYSQSREYISDEYFYLLKEIFSYIEQEVVENFEIVVGDGLYKYGILDLFYYTESIIYGRPLVTGFDKYKKQVCVSYYSSRNTSRKLGFYSNNECVFPLHKTKRIYKFLDNTFIEKNIVWFDLSDDNRFSIREDSQFLELKYKGNLFDSISMSDILESEIKAKPTKLSRGAKFYRAMAKTTYFSNKYKDAWLLMDRDVQADDNAEHLYNYIKDHDSTINAFFVLNRNSVDWSRLKKKGFRLLEFGSVEHKIALLNCSQLVSSHADRYVTDYLPRKYYSDLLSYKFTFLQHGVTKDDLSHWLNSKKIDLFICSSDREATSIRESSSYKFSSKEVVTTGFPRHDHLLNLELTNIADSILIMPTWRNSLVGKITGKGNCRELISDFEETDYFRYWNDLINSPAIIDYAKKHNLTLIFYPHTNITPYLDLFDTEHVQTFRHGDIESMQQLFAKCKLLITDYSSVAFEVAYTNKDVLYYQFDHDQIYTGSHTYEKGYYCYKENGFGPLIKDISELDVAFRELELSRESYQSRRDEFFRYRDGLCCERVFNKILSLDSLGSDI